MLPILCSLAFGMQGVSIEVEKPTRRIVVDAGAGGYQAFPDVCRLRNGDLLCVFYAGYGHVSLPTTDHPTGGRICAVRSTDEGQTWSDPWTVVDTPEDDRDPSVCCLPDGTLLGTFFTYRKGGVCDTQLIRSKDGGQTWTQPALVLPSYATSTPIRRLRSGRLVLPVYTTDGTKRQYAAVCLSDDNATTWSAPKPIGLNAGLTINETDVYEREDGTVYALCRETMVFAESKDRGETWSEPKDVGFAGHCPAFLMTRHGVLLVAHRLPQTALHFSLDEGRTWRGPVQIDDFIGAYPSMVQLRDGRVLCLYYEEGEGSAIRAAMIRLVTVR